MQETLAQDLRGTLVQTKDISLDARAFYVFAEDLRCA